MGVTLHIDVVGIFREQSFQTPYKIQFIYIFVGVHNVHYSPIEISKYRPAFGKSFKWGRPATHSPDKNWDICRLLQKQSRCCNMTHMTQQCLSASQNIYWKNSLAQLRLFVKYFAQPYLIFLLSHNTTCCFVIKILHYIICDLKIIFNVLNGQPIKSLASCM